MEKISVNKTNAKATEDLHQTLIPTFNRRKKDRRAINTCIDPKFERRFYNRRIKK